MLNKKKPGNAQLSLTESLLWIIASVFLITGPSYIGFKYYLEKKNAFEKGPESMIFSLIQTGPQFQALKTQHLAEILGLSIDQPVSSVVFDLKSAQKKLLQFPLISAATVKLFNSNTVYIDYTMRQPIAWIEDFENTVIDKEGYPFPFSPYFSPKNLPALYFGISESLDEEKPKIEWNMPISGKYAELAADLLNIISAVSVCDQFNVKRIDVSNAFTESYGTREIILITEDTLLQQLNEKEIHCIIPRLLRLSTKNYPQELGNYLQLRPQLFEEERKLLPSVTENETIVRLDPKIIDFRLSKLAYIE